jgi:K+-transporting ATPase KdpF subunit
MGLFSWVQHNAGLVTLTVVASLLTLYLVYAMLHPERF